VESFVVWSRLRAPGSSPTSLWVGPDAMLGAETC
jgi:hypothetical protein